MSDVIRLEAAYNRLLSKCQYLETEVDGHRQFNTSLQKRIAELESILRKIADWNGMWGPYPETNKDWATMAVMAAREALPEPPQEAMKDE